MPTFSGGVIDRFQQIDMAGWAIEGDCPATVEILINNEVVRRVDCTLPRPDVAKAIPGAPDGVGFAVSLPRAARAFDVVEARLARSRMPLQNSPEPQQQRRSERLGYKISRSPAGMEIGALDRPFLARPTFNVHYVDHANTAALREKYRNQATFLDNIEDVDIVWVPRLSLLDCAGGRFFSYAVASQVIEHIANPIGWLNQIADCLDEGGRINLSIPEQTRTFDAHRRLSSAADLLDAYERRLTRPTFRQVFDHIAEVASPEEKPDHTNIGLLHGAYAMARAAEVGTYVDVHCHVWTHDSFVDCWQFIDALGVANVTLDQCWPALPGANEFIVSFVKKN